MTQPGDVSVEAEVEARNHSRAKDKLALYGGTPVRTTPVPITRPEITIGDINAVTAVLASRVLSRGPLREELEARVAELTGAQRAVVFSSGTAALHAAVQALQLPEGSEVIVPSFSFVSTAFAPIYCGLKPVFADIDAKTFNLDPEDVRARITENTRLIIPVHYAGQVCDLEPLLDVAEAKGIPVLEDAAQAIGATYQSKPVGSWSEMTMFSLFASKNVTGGEGGIVVTDSEPLAQAMRSFRTYGQMTLPDAPVTTGYYDISALGHNFNLSDLNIALALSQLERVRELNEARQMRAARYTALLSELPEIILPRKQNDHVFHLYTIRLRLEQLRASREEIVRALLAEGITVALRYPPIHLFTYFRERYGTHEGMLPVTEKVGESLLCLPMFPGLTEQDQQAVAEALFKVLELFRV